MNQRIQGMLDEFAEALRYGGRPYIDDSGTDLREGNARAMCEQGPAMVVYMTSTDFAAMFSHVLSAVWIPENLAEPVCLASGKTLFVAKDHEEAVNLIKGLVALDSNSYDSEDELTGFSLEDVHAILTAALNVEELVVHMFTAGEED